MSHLKSTSQKITLTAALLGASFSIMAADLDMSVDSNDLAIKGYDPVAYFDNKGPVKGTSEFTATYKNAIYQFVSSENRDQFRADPQAYAPQYGGYCAFGVAMGKKFETDPQAWKIEDGKLYLNLASQYKNVGWRTHKSSFKMRTTIGPRLKRLKPISSR
ncbi:hypothetical protein VSWAT3_17828 [Vibrionales bacterium SWAT-3]|nr:hypothetical protein VSWAT3_17828 [Vibrionales bacterium SWAT-3]